MLKTPFMMAHRLLMLVAIVVIVSSLGLLGLFVFRGELAEEFTSGRQPTQFFRDLDDDLLESYGQVFGVAHNSGDSLRATRVALAHGADVIEMDVVSLGGELYAAHLPPQPWIGARAFRGPSLAAVWALATEADAVKLDLKESSPRFLDLVFAFLDERRDEHQVLIATRDVATLQAFAVRCPEVFRFLSVPTLSHFQELQQDEDVIALIDGVTIRHTLLDETSAGWLEDRGLLVLAWTVNDLWRVNQLVLLGVDAITTDNLAILQLLGGQERGEVILARRKSAPEPGEQPAGKEAKRR